MLKKRVLLYNPPPRISSILSRANCCSNPPPSDSPSFNHRLRCLAGIPSPPAGDLFHPAAPISSSSIRKGFDPNSFVGNRNFLISWYSKSVEKLRCWNCGGDESVGTTAAFLFCDACRSVQPVDESVDFFQIFGLERKYQIELEELEKKYKDWQKKLHPDLVHSKSQRERDYAAEQSARVIDAYRTLTDPLSRAIYAVRLEGVVVDEEERITDPTLLPEVMELREAVDEAEDTQALKKIQAQLQEKLQKCFNTFEDAYRSKNYDDALASIRRMTYYKRANEEIVKKL